jgi:NADP-dependent 3-hydroxy acid dehydrogenase YdfG
MTEGLRQEARGGGLPLRVTAISPGLVDSEFFTHRAFGDAEARARAVGGFPPLQPADVAQSILWALAAPPHVEIDDIVVRPTAQLV